MISNFWGKLIFTYVGCDIFTECTFGSATFCNYGEEDNYLLSDRCKSNSVNNDKEKDDNNNVDDINERILSN